MKVREQYHDENMGRLVPFRLLSSYISTHRKIAQKNNVQEAFEKAKTLTQARRILWGSKTKKERNLKD